MQQLSKGQNPEQRPSAYGKDKPSQIKQSILGPGSHTVSSISIPKEGFMLYISLI